MTQRSGLLTALLATVALITGALLLDVQREFDAAVQSMREEQMALATAVAADFESRLARHEDQSKASTEPSIPTLLGGAIKLEQRRSRILLVARPGRRELSTSHGQLCDARGGLCPRCEERADHARGSQRGQRVRLSAHDERGRLYFVVEDEGEGISPETALRAREAFFTTKPKGRGTGLGLAIGQEVVAHHRGKLTLEKREPGRGTRAVIELPQS